MSAPRPRASALIYHPERPDEVLLILRRKNGRAYATLPGGGIDDGETPAQACAREVMEEVNLDFAVGEQVLEMQNQHQGEDKCSHEHYFVGRIVGGEMRLGDGPEGIRQSEDNHYEPQWVKVSRLEEVNFVPEGVRDLVRQYSTPTTSTP